MLHLAPPFRTNFHQTTSAPRWTEFLQMARLCGPLYRQTSHWSPYLFWRDFKGPLKSKTCLEVKSSFACFRAAGFHPEKPGWLTRKEHVNLVGFHHKWNLVWQFWLCEGVESIFSCGNDKRIPPPGFIAKDQQVFPSIFQSTSQTATPAGPSVNEITPPLKYLNPSQSRWQ